MAPMTNNEQETAMRMQRAQSEEIDRNREIARLQQQGLGASQSLVGLHGGLGLASLGFSSQFAQQARIQAYEEMKPEKQSTFKKFIATDHFWFWVGVVLMIGGGLMFGFEIYEYLSLMDV